MLDPRTATEEGHRPDVMRLLDRLSNDGRRWADAEVTLARAEIGEFKAQAIRAAAFAILGFAAMFCALLALTLAAIAFLSPYVGGEGFGALIVMIFLVLLVILSFQLMRKAMSWRAESIFFRWFAARPPAGSGP